MPGHGQPRGRVQHRSPHHRRSAISDNQPNGGVYFEDGTASGTPFAIRSSTITGNASTGDGGGIYFNGALRGASATLDNVTVASNTADSDANGSGNGGGLYVIFGTVAVHNSILCGNVDTGGEAPNTFAQYGSIATNAAGNVLDTFGCPELVLGPLQDNGGPTPTRELLPPSSGPFFSGLDFALGGGEAYCDSIDQRGVPRPMGRSCDAGAFEIDPCAFAPKTSCKHVPALKSKIVIKTSPNPASNKLTWVWTRGDASTMDEFGFIGSSQDFDAACLWDESTTPATRIMRLDPSLATTCGTKACWTTQGNPAIGIKYSDTTSSAAGIKSIGYKSGVAGKTKITLKAGGTHLPVATVAPAPARAARLHPGWLLGSQLHRRQHLEERGRRRQRERHVQGEGQLSHRSRRGDSPNVAS